MLLVSVIMALGALGVMTLGTAALFDFGPFDSDGSAKLKVADRPGDCREAGLDRGEHCAAGADVEEIRLWMPDGSTLAVELQLDSAPSLGPAVAWTTEFFVDAASAFTEGGIICRLSNVEDGGPPRREAVSRPLDPNRIPRAPVDARACDGRLDGSAARFLVDITGQPAGTQFRLIGLVRLERPQEPGDPGSEDDFLVRASLADLRG